MRVRLVLPFVVACLLAACADDGSEPASTGGAAADVTPTATATIAAPAAGEMAGRGAYGVGVTTRNFVDTSRPTEANRDFPGSRQREFETIVWYPAAPSDAAESPDAPPANDGAPFPLIIFAHGYSSIARQSASFMQHLASHGYVVAAPSFPQTRVDTPGGPRLWGVLDQPADISFVMDELLRIAGKGSRSKPGDPLLAGVIDGERIGVTGHSGGGLTAMLTAYGARRDARVDAVLPISPVGCLIPGDIAETGGVPAMIVGGSIERIVGIASIRLAYEAASPPKYFVEVVGGDHVRFGDFDVTDAQLDGVLDRSSRGDIAADTRRTARGTGADAAACMNDELKDDVLIPAADQRRILRTVALPFFNYYLKEDEAAWAFLTRTLPALEGIRFEAVPAAEPAAEP